MNQQKQLSPEKYIRQNGLQLPFHESFINDDWKKEGMASVFISKRMPSGKFIVGMYMVDLFCLGLKSTTFRFSLNELEYKELYQKMFSSGNGIACELIFAHNLIFGAIDYAQDLGFEPEKEFEITRHLLDESLIDDGIDELEFGKNGQPLYFQGPHDNANHIIAILERNVGAGNYKIILAS